MWRKTGKRTMQKSLEKQFPHTRVHFRACFLAFVSKPQKAWMSSWWFELGCERGISLSAPTHDFCSRFAHRMYADVMFDVMKGRYCVCACFWLLFLSQLVAVEGLHRLRQNLACLLWQWSKRKWFSIWSWISRRTRRRTSRRRCWQCCCKGNKTIVSSKFQECCCCAFGWRPALCSLEEVPNSCIIKLCTVSAITHKQTQQAMHLVSNRTCDRRYDGKRNLNKRQEQKNETKNDWVASWRSLNERYRRRDKWTNEHNPLSGRFYREVINKSGKIKQPPKLSTAIRSNSMEDASGELLKVTEWWDCAWLRLESTEKADNGLTANKNKTKRSKRTLVPLRWPCGSESNSGERRSINSIFLFLYVAALFFLCEWDGRKRKRKNSEKSQDDVREKEKQHAKTKKGRETDRLTERPTEKETCMHTLHPS